MSRIRDVLGLIAREPICVEPNFAQSLINIAQNSQSEVKPIDNVVDGVKYSKYKNVATIFVDGVMYKKDIGGLCTTVASYDQIKGYLARANADDEVTDIVFKVDTNGGSVAGVEALRLAIKNSKKTTHLIAENGLYSAGMWVFTSTNKIYANDKNTKFGSIGVLIAYKPTNEEIYYLVSEDAENKVCDIESEECKNRIQNDLNAYKDRFLKVLSERFIKEPKQIVEDFDRGGAIFAETAHKLGYIDGIKTYESLLDELTHTLATMPPSNGKIVNQTNGKELAMTDAERIAQLEQDLATANVTIQDLQSKVGGVADLQAKYDDLMAKQDGLVSKEIVTAVLNIADFNAVDKDTLISAISEDSAEKAENTVLKAIQANIGNEESLGGATPTKKADGSAVWEKFIK